MQIKIDLKIFIFAIIFIITKNIKIYGLLMLFALIHELGHLICGFLLGLKPQSMSILPYGFKIIFNAYPEDYNAKIKSGNLLSVKKIILALAGPLTNIICILIENIAKLNIGDISYQSIIYANILIAIFNLLPIYPLDGGKILQEILHINCGLSKSYKYTMIITKISIAMLIFLSSFLILIYKNVGILIVIIYVIYIAYISIKEFKLKEKIYTDIEKYKLHGYQNV